MAWGQLGNGLLGVVERMLSDLFRLDKKSSEALGEGSGFDPISNVSQGFADCVYFSAFLLYPDYLQVKKPIGCFLCDHPSGGRTGQLGRDKNVNERSL